MLNLQLKYKIVVKNKDGEVIKEIEEAPAKSFVKNFLSILRGAFVGSGATVTDVEGNSVSATIGVNWDNGWCNSGQIWCNSGRRWCNGGTLYVHTNMLWINAPEGDDTYGIVVGTGDTAVTPDDYKLASQIAHGSGDGQLYYKACSVGKPNIVDSGVRVVVSRVFRNDGNSDITIAEIGIVALVIADTTSSAKVLIIRDVLTEPVTIPAGGGIGIVTYEIKI